jgi:hypothetical protein
MKSLNRILLGLFFVGGALVWALPVELKADDAQAPSANSTRAEMEYRAVERTRPSYQQVPQLSNRREYNTATQAVYRQSKTRASNRAVAVAYEEPTAPVPAPTPAQATAPAVSSEGALAPVVGPDAGDPSLAPVAAPGFVEEGVGVPGGCDNCGSGGACCPGGGEVWGDGCCCCNPLAGLGNLLWVPFISLEAGAHGFKGPLDNGLNGNFGFQEGATLAGPIGHIFFQSPELRELGYHVGVRGTQSNFNGFFSDSNTASGYHDIGREQVFFTAGLFHRAMCPGLQWDVAFDYLHDTRGVDLDVKQVRAELSYACPGSWEAGFWGAFGGDTRLTTFTLRQGVSVDQTTESLNIYALFFRHYFCGGGEFRFWAGMTEKSDAVFGTDVRVPLAESLAIEHNILFMSPNGAGTANGYAFAQEREAWSIMVNLVWYPGQASHCIEQNPYRPILNTASNSSFIVDVK